MSSILNSISSGDLQVQNVPRENPIKEDSILDLLQTSEIEFEDCVEIVDPLENVNTGFNELNELYFDKQFHTSKVEPPEKITTTLEVEQCPQLEESVDNFNTGFGNKNDLHFECKKPALKLPLYKENYLQEFKTQEEKAAARHALGLYNKEDVVAMSLLTAEDSVPNNWKNISLKELRKGDKFFAPYTTTNAVFDSDGISLQVKLKEITQESNGNNIVSLGDMKKFLQGFTKGDTLYTTINKMNQDMLRFEKTGQISV